MSQQTNKTLIGGFVVGALVLVVAGVLVFGSGKMFKKTIDYVMYFQGSVKGLNVGAPLVFKGVKVGAVKEIILQADASKLSFQVPVIVELDPTRIQVLHGKQDGFQEGRFKQLIDLGLRAQLQTQSMVTGQLIIDLDFHPDKPVRLVNDTFSLPEVPTIPSTIDEITKTVGELPLKEIAEKLNLAIVGIERIVSSPELKSSIKNLDLTLVKAQELLTNVNNQVGPLSGSALKLMKNVDAELKPLAESIRRTADTANQTIKQAEKTLMSADEFLGSKSQLRYQIAKMLEELVTSARSIRVWADYLERHPEALLQGKK